MYEVRVLGSVRGLEPDMQGEIHETIEGALSAHFGEHGLFEIFVIERQIELPAEER